MLPNMMDFNSSLDFVAAPYTQNLVTIDSCRSFVESTLFWNKVYQALLFVMVVYCLYITFRRDKNRGLNNARDNNNMPNNNDDNACGNRNKSDDAETRDY